MPIASIQWMRVTHHPSTDNPERLILKMNLPVVDVEYQIHDHTMIVSKTDIKGKITYINDQFIEVSGFSEAELLNQPHNVVRHPDMPSEAFTDLWEALKGGRPWTGAVKNRRKKRHRYRLHVGPHQTAGRSAA